MTNSFYRYRTFTATKRDHEERYRYEITAKLLEESEGRQWEITKIMADLDREPTSWEFPAETLAYALTALEDLNTELDRRQRLRFSHGSPAWPQKDSRNLDAMKSLAVEMKLLWPVEDFCRQVLNMPLVRRGKHLTWTCPIPDHHEATPSFKISPDKNVWYCHGCNRGGDIFSLVGFSQGLDLFGEQLGWLADLSARYLSQEVTHVG